MRGWPPTGMAWQLTFSGVVAVRQPNDHGRGLRPSATPIRSLTQTRVRLKAVTGTLRGRLWSFSSDLHGD
jgi:hypothetical protein